LLKTTALCPAIYLQRLNSQWWTSCMDCLWAGMSWTPLACIPVSQVHVGLNKMWNQNSNVSRWTTLDKLLCHQAYLFDRQLQSHKTSMVIAILWRQRQIFILSSLYDQWKGLIHPLVDWVATELFSNGGEEKSTCVPGLECPSSRHCTLLTELSRPEVVSDISRSIVFTVLATDGG
jgi:hypothetical protein